MSTEHHPTGRAFVELALALEQHIPGYVDAYFGPEMWREKAQAEGARPLAELQREAAGLAAAVESDGSLDPLRKDYVRRSVHAMQTSLRILDGEAMPFAHEVQALYDIHPQWVDEAVFEKAHRTLEELLPAGGTLAEREEAHNKATEVPVERLSPLFGHVVGELRCRTEDLFELPADNQLELKLVKDQPWAAYNWYLGEYRSRVDVCTDLPVHVQHVAALMAHEGYPGHHTERSIKEAILYRDRSQTEQCAVLTLSPGSVVSEGLANQALATVMTKDQRIAWHDEELFSLAGLGHLDGRREHEINEAKRSLEGVMGNAGFLLHDQGAEEEEILAYLRQYALMTAEEAAKALQFLASPLWGSYVFNYRYGEGMLERLFAACGDRKKWFAKMLAEPVTPSQIEAWTVA